MKFLIIAILLFLLIFGTKPIRGFFRGLFGFEEPDPKRPRRVQDAKPPKRGKFFKKDDGEYVDFEEEGKN